MQSLLFNTSAAVAGISAIHHIFRGPHELYPAFNGLTNKPRRAARTAWDYMVVSYMVTSKSLSFSVTLAPNNLNKIQ